VTVECGSQGFNVLSDGPNKTLDLLYWVLRGIQEWIGAIWPI
jgi:hypothetical protein